MIPKPPLPEVSCELAVRVIPNASRDQIVGWHAGALKIKTVVQPESGKANQAICALLAAHLSLPKRAVSVVSGGASSQKCLQIIGLEKEMLLNRLPPA